MWYQFNNIDSVASPALLVYPDRIEKNIQEMIRLTGSAGRLRPHVKTHKMPEIVKLQLRSGINKFKCATIAEAEMVASCGASDILLAIQPVGPNIDRFFQIKRMFPEVKFSCITDCREIIIKLSEMADKNATETHIWLDINAGMDRTGIKPGPKAIDLYRLIAKMPYLIAEGLHVYDGHLHEKDFTLRKKHCDESFAAASLMAEELTKSGFSPVSIVAGGTPTFPIHAARKNVECSPGTTILWDGKSSHQFSDMGFLNAAVLLTRVISKPSRGLLCLDLGHKAVASEMEQPRVQLFGISSYTIISQNEEHMVIKTDEADLIAVGQHFFGIPWHICPTVDRYDTVSVVNDRVVTDIWNVEARKRKLTV